MEEFIYLFNTFALSTYDTLHVLEVFAWWGMGGGVSGLPGARSNLSSKMSPRQGHHSGAVCQKEPGFGSHLLVILGKLCPFLGLLLPPLQSCQCHVCTCEGEREKEGPLGDPLPLTSNHI